MLGTEPSGSLRGLLVGSGAGSYLSVFYPRLDIGRPHLIPVSTGFNVLYGRNGAGKTHMLEALAAASQWRTGPLEGFVFSEDREGDRTVQPRDRRRLGGLTLEQVFKSIVEPEWGADSKSLGWVEGFDPALLDRQTISTVVDIVAEFLNQGWTLLARSVRPQSMSGGLRFELAHRQVEDIVAPQTTEVVPVLLSSHRAPIARAHLQEMRASLLAHFDAGMRARGCTRADSSGESWNYRRVQGGEPLSFWDDHFMEEVVQSALEQWRAMWAWSPLFIDRNLGYLGAFLDEHPNDFANLALHNRLAPVFLPPLIIHTREAASDFGDDSAAALFKPFRERTLGTGGAADLRLEAPPGRPTEESDEERRERAMHYFACEVAKLKSRVAFLPDLASHLEAQADLDMGTSATLQIGRGIAANQGSRAEVRWLEFAMKADGDWLFLDEPEAGLHRTAEADLATCLASPVWAEGRSIVVATHSPEFLALPNANILHVDEGQAKPLTAIDREQLALLGLRPSDLLSRARTFLLVEGEHERIIFQTLFGEDLYRLRCSILVARGGKNMRDVFDSQVLFDFTDATVIALLDNTNASKVHDLWGRARALAVTGQVDEAGDLVRKELPGKESGENRFLAQFLTRALEDGQHERVAASGLSKQDIILYLDPAAFGIKRSWDRALADYNPETSGPLKDWLTKKYGADFRLNAFRTAAETLNEVPDEFRLLLHAIEMVDQRG